MTTTNGKLLERVAKLEQRVESELANIKKSIDDIKDNHLHTLQSDVSDLKIKLNTLTVKVSAIVAIATVTVNIVLEVVFRFLIK